MKYANLISRLNKRGEDKHFIVDGVRFPLGRDLIMEEAATAIIALEEENDSLKSTINLALTGYVTAGESDVTRLHKRIRELEIALMKAQGLKVFYVQEEQFPPAQCATPREQVQDDKGTDG